MAVETMVWSRLESSMPAMSAEKMIQMRFCVSRTGAAPTAVEAGEDMRFLFVGVLGGGGEAGGEGRRAELAGALDSALRRGRAAQQGAGRGHAGREDLVEREGVLRGEVGLGRRVHQRRDQKNGDGCHGVAGLEALASR